MTDRKAQMREFVDQTEWSGADITPLAGDASFRRYERVRLHDNQAVLMDAPPDKEDIAPFVKVAHYLQECGFSSPKILAENKQNGFLLLEDLGDDLYTRCLAGDTNQEIALYRAAVELLAELHQTNIPLDVPSYDQSEFMREVALFSEWFLPAVMGDQSSQLASDYMAIWQRILQTHPLKQNSVVLRDYHADNLLWLPERQGVKRVGVLDFQDALIGHPAYDLVSLLEDARRDIAPETVQDALQHYLALSGEDEAQFMTDYALLGAQRNAKIIGIFIRLAMRDGKKDYIDYLPRVWKHFEHDLQHSILAPLKNWVDEHIKPEWRGKISV